MTNTVPVDQLAGGRLTVSQRLLIYIPVIFCALLGIFVAEYRPYAQGSDLGYYLGLIGGSMMLSLYIYPIRKYWKPLQHWGTLRAWFVAHLIFGICGPVLVLFHASFQTRSINGRVAFWSMVVVVISGIIGRFLYVHVSENLEGNSAVLGSIDSFLNPTKSTSPQARPWPPAALGLMNQYRQYTWKTQTSIWGRAWAAVTLSHRANQLIAQCKLELANALKVKSEEQKWSRGRHLAELKVAYDVVTEYTVAANKAAHYAFWEKLLAWWHIIHIPLVYILLGSGIYHVVAVHMY